MDRPSATFCNGKYSVLDLKQHSVMEKKHFCTISVLLEFLAYYILENKSNKTCKYQPDEIDDNLIENNHEEFLPKKI